MNRKIYWKIRKKLLTIVFKCKRKLHFFFDRVEGVKEYESLKAIIVKRMAIRTIKATLLTAGLLLIDNFLLVKYSLSNSGINLFVYLIIGGIGVAGVILGLYCSNIASIYSRKYDDAPENVSNAFINDSLVKKCMNSIIGYIGFGFIILVAILANISVGWVTVIAFVGETIIVIVTYSFVGNRSYQLSSIFEVGNDSFDSINRITKRFNDSIFASDINFQDSYRNYTTSILKNLTDIRDYAHKKNSDDLSQTRFTINILKLVNNYWIVKRTISTTSPWFLNKVKYPKWHLAADFEISMAIKTGRALQIGLDSDYWWFEDSLLNINKSCVLNILENKNITSLNAYLVFLKSMCRTAIECREVKKYVSHIHWLIGLIKDHSSEYSSTKEEKELFASTIDKIVQFCTEIILESTKAYKGYDERIVMNQIKKAIDSGKKIEKQSIIRGRYHRDNYEKIIKEVIVEGRRITPDWLIEQYVAEEEYIELNNLIKTIEDCINDMFELGKHFYNKKMYFESCIIISRFYEYNSKLPVLLNILNSTLMKLKKYKKEPTVEWEELNIAEFEKEKLKWEKSIPNLFAECSEHFTLDNWDKRENYPDFLGECFYYTCEEAIKSIVKKDLNGFKNNYDNLSKLMLMYQEYIRTDLLNGKPSSDKSYIYYSMTFPIVEWAQIGGLAILWGEMNSSDEWKKSVESSVNCFLEKKYAEAIVELVRDRDRHMFGFRKGMFLDTRWTQSIIESVKELDICEYDGVEYELKTDSELLKIFCGHNLLFGFAVNPSEALWVMCVNPLLAKDKQFKSTGSWEKRLKNEND